MTRKPQGPVKDAPARLRQRMRVDGSWRIWWEPEAPVRKLGFATVELDADTPVRAARKARELNDAVAKARLTGGIAPVKRGPMCIEDVAEDYLRSMQFLEGLAAKTQAGYRTLISLIIRKWGDVAVADFTKPMARTWYESLHRDAGSYQAVSLIRMLSILMSHAELRGWRDENSNPCFRLGVSIPKPRDRVVSWAEYDALYAAALRVGLPSMALAVALAFLTGQRQTDVIGAVRGDFAERQVRWPGADDPVPVWVWQLARAKTGAAGSILLHAELAPMVAAVLDRPGAPDARLIVEERVGRPYDVDLFQLRWGEVRAAAIAGGTGHAPSPSLTGMQFRDLRRSFSSHARHGGASVDDAGDALGNSAGSNARIKGTYMPADFFTAARAVSAVNRPTAKGRKEA
jgi:integrase